MTAVSCVLLWLAFLAAAGLLLLAGILMGWVLPRLIARRLRGPGDSGRV